MDPLMRMRDARSCLLSLLLLLWPLSASAQVGPTPTNIVDATNINIANVTAAGEVDVRCTGCFGGGAVTANQGTAAATSDASAWPVKIVFGNVHIDPRLVTVQNAGGAAAVNIQDGGNSLTVDAVNLDIRDLVFATDKIDASGTTLGANSGVDIGDVTINNAAGAAAVNVQDGGNTLTVDAVDLDVRNLVFATDKVDASGTVLGAGMNNIGDVDVLTFPDNEPINIAQFGGSAVVTGVGASGAGIPRVTEALDPLTYNAPFACTVGVASGTCLAANTSRKAARFINTSNNTISCAVAATAVLNSGITLEPGAAWNMGRESLATGAVNCIAGGAGSNLSGQEIQ